MFLLGKAELIISRVFKCFRNMSTAKKHKSSQDFKNKALTTNAVKKLGGQVEADALLVKWQLHRASEGVCDRYSLCLSFVNFYFFL